MRQRLFAVDMAFPLVVCPCWSTEVVTSDAGRDPMCRGAIWVGNVGVVWDFLCRSSSRGRNDLAGWHIWMPSGSGGRRGYGKRKRKVNVHNKWTHCFIAPCKCQIWKEMECVCTQLRNSYRYTRYQCSSWKKNLIVLILSYPSSWRLEDLMSSALAHSNFFPLFFSKFFYLALFTALPPFLLHFAPCPMSIPTHYALSPFQFSLSPLN